MGKKQGGNDKSGVFEDHREGRLLGNTVSPPEIKQRKKRGEWGLKRKRREVKEGGGAQSLNWPW